MAHRVFDQIAQGRIQQQCIATHHDGLGCIHRQRVFAQPCALGLCSRNIARHGGPVHGLQRRIQHSAPSSGQGQQLVEHMTSVQGILPNALQSRLHGSVIGLRARLESLRLQNDGGQWRAQLMRHLIGQIALARQRLLLAVKQCIDGVHHGRQLTRHIGI